MHYYPVWFDYAKWLFSIAGGFCAFAMMTEPASRKRGWLKLGFCCFIAMAMLFGGAAGVIFNSRAAIHEATGTVFGSNVTRGRGATTRFRIPQPEGEFDFSITGTHDAIENGEVVRVIYQDASYAVLSVEVIDGVNQGYRFRDTTNLHGSWFVVMLALVLAGYGLLDWMNDGTAIPPPDDRSAPDGDVDTKSVLDLS
jgi:hypothetical protein